MMALNIGNVDRLVRILVGAWGWIGIVPIATGLVAWCPLYRVLGIRTTAR